MTEKIKSAIAISRGKEIHMRLFFVEEDEFEFKEICVPLRESNYPTSNGRCIQR